MTPARPRFPWILTALAVAALAVLVSLGTWQVRRLAWKQGLIARAEAAAEAPAILLADLAAQPGDPEFRHVVPGCDMRGRPYVELQSIHDGEPGVRLIGECRGWLIDMGFVSERVSARPPVGPAGPTDDRLVPSWQAQVRAAPTPGPFAPPPSGRRFYARDNVAMAKALGLSESPGSFVLYAADSPIPEWRALKTALPPAAFSNNHLGYALTWFGLALALAGFYVALLRRHYGKPQP